MPSRRIGTHVNLSPIQELSVNPFSNLDSDSINKLTRIVSGGKDGVVFGLDVKHRLDDKQAIEVIDVFNPNSDNNTYGWTNRDKYTYPIPNVAYSNCWSGFSFKNITDYCIRKIELEVPITKLKCREFLGKDINCKFNFKFNLDGNPRELRLYVNDDNSILNYPRNNNDKMFDVDVLHNFRKDHEEDNNIRLSIYLILDPNDPYTTFKKDNTVFYHGQSDINITNLHITYNVLNDRSLFYNPTDSNNCDYPDAYIHPVKEIFITPGIAIKDDLVIDFKSIAKGQETIKLDLSSNKSWIRNNRYEVEEFTSKSNNQKAYIYSKRGYTQLDELTGYIDERTEDLVFKKDVSQSDYTYDGFIIDAENHLVIQNGSIYNNERYLESYDDFPWSRPTTLMYNLSDDWDLSNSFALYDAYGSAIFLNNNKTEISFSIPNIFSKFRLYIVNKETNKVIKELNRIDETFQQKDFPLNLKDPDIKSKIGIYISQGPIKISGYRNRYNTDMVKWAYVVLYYTYLKDPNPNKAYIGLIRDTDLDDLRFREDYVVLAKVRFVSPNTVDIISYEDRQHFYQPYNKADHIEYSSCIPPEEEYLWTNPQSGSIDTPRTVYDAIQKLIKWKYLLYNIRNKEMLDVTYPIGSIYIGTQEECPFKGLFGNWIRITQGQCIFNEDNDENSNEEVQNQSLRVNMWKRIE